jgi:WD40 repeat protein
VGRPRQVHIAADPRPDLRRQRCDDGAWGCAVCPRGLGASYRKLNLLVVETSEGIYLAHLPSLQVQRLLPLDDLGYTVSDVSAGGSWLAWLAGEGTVRVWNLQEDRLERELSGLGESCCSQVLLTPDGDSLVTLAGQTATVWDLVTGSEVYSRPDVQAVHVSPDGSRLAFESGVGFRVSLWDRRTRQDVRQLTGFETAAPLYGVRFSPDWSSMYWAARASMQFSEVETERAGCVRSLLLGEFSPHGDRIVAVEDGWIYATVGQASAGRPQRDPGGARPPRRRHHPGGSLLARRQLIATGLGQTIKIWNASSGTEITTLPQAGGSVHDLAFSPDQRLLMSRSEGDLIELWVVEGGAEPAADVISAATAGTLAPVDSLQLEETATDAVFSPDGSDIAVPPLPARSGSGTSPAARRSRAHPVTGTGSTGWPTIPPGSGWRVFPKMGRFDTGVGQDRSTPAQAGERASSRLWRSSRMERR